MITCASSGGVSGPKFMVPRHRRLTDSPERPRFAYSMAPAFHSPRSPPLQVPVEEGDDPVDRGFLDRVRAGGVAGAQREYVTVLRVVPGHPLGILARLGEELVAEGEHALEVVVVPAHDQHRQVDPGDALAGDREVGP